ncbi:MAG: flippase-like domain-containing protein [Chitinophagaceae bacterium]|nr:flippase-like domain-containing protein [Chitinophagaceae bacterium]
MQKKAIAILQYLLFLGLGIFLVWWSLHKIPADKWDAFKNSLKTANYWLMIPVFFILSGSHVIRTLRWRVLIKPLGHNPSIPNTFFAVMIGYLANLAIPRLGEVLKCTILARYENVPADKLVGTILIERVCDVISLGIVFLIAFTVQFDTVGEYGQALIGKVFKNNNGTVSFNNVLIAVALLIIIISLITFIFKKYQHIGFVKKINDIVKGIGTGLGSILKLEQKGLFLVYTCLIWLLYILGTWVGLLATTGTSHLGLDTAISALAFASIGMIITPGGIGAYAFFLAEILSLKDIPAEIGLANGTLQWFAQFMIVLIVGFISVGALAWYNKNKKYESSSAHKS